LKGTYTDGDLCTYTASGTLLNCNTAVTSGMVWPGTAGIPYWTSGTSWGGAYNASTLIPNSYINWASPSAIGTGTPAAVTATSVTIPCDGVHPCQATFAGNTTENAFVPNTWGITGPLETTFSAWTQGPANSASGGPTGNSVQIYPVPVNGVSRFTLVAAPVGAFVGYYSVGAVTWNNAGNCTYNATSAYSTDGTLTTVSGQSCTLVMTNLVSGGYFNVIITNAASTAATLTLGTSGSTCTAWKVGGAGGGSITLSGASAIDILAVHMVGTVCYANFKGQFS
jgi:hypothetical protein